MHRLRRNGYTNREIAEKVSRSERTVRRYVGDIEPDVKLRPEFGSDQLMDWFYDEILAKRRSVVAWARQKWDERFELGVDSPDGIEPDDLEQLERVARLLREFALTRKSV